jgi:hypothetical protein
MATITTSLFFIGAVHPLKPVDVPEQLMHPVVEVYGPDAQAGT